MFSVAQPCVEAVKQKCQLTTGSNKNDDKTVNRNKLNKPIYIVINELLFMVRGDNPPWRLTKLFDVYIAGGG